MIYENCRRQVWNVQPRHICASVRDAWKCERFAERHTSPVHPWDTMRRALPLHVSSACAVYLGQSLPRGIDTSTLPYTRVLPAGAPRVDRAGCKKRA